MWYVVIIFFPPSKRFLTFQETLNHHAGRSVKPILLTAQRKTGEIKFHALRRLHVIRGGI